MSNLGFIGLGAMGLPMARNLAAAGHEVIVYDPADAVRDRAGAVDGISVAESGAAVAAASDVLFTCVPNDAVIRAVYLGDGGIAGAVRAGATTVDCSTVSPGVTREVSAALAEKGVMHVDAAMLGSVPQAEAGEIGFVVGGEVAAYDRAAPLLDILGRMHRHAGPSGSGHMVKLVHQTLVATQAAIVAEALGLCLATETDPDVFYEIVCGVGGFAHSRYFENRVPRMRAGDFSPLFALEFMAKDAGLARDAADAVGYDTPVLDRVLALFEDAKQAGWSREDFSAVAHVYERALGRPFADG